MADKMPNIHAIFNAAIELDSAEARSKYLDEACQGDPHTKGRVESLLRAHGDAGSFLWEQSNTTDFTLDQAPLSEEIGTFIGPYKLHEEIGEGGMGTVFMALQKKPVRRKVALKVIKPGMDSKQVVNRFEAERQALAMMDHPNIAHVHDGGTTDSGRPYFVMELVKGIPITDYCDQYRLTTRQRLDLFLDVCRAVHHAHQKGIIHRDLKPTNILVTVIDGKAVPKVIDFGIAKAISGHLTEDSVVTNVTQMVGTPLYMSPEQAQLSGVDVDTRSDVYSLGVLLYELLVGSPPFDRERMKGSSLDEIRRIIREEEPPRPSTRLSTLNVALETVAEKHHSDVGTLSRELRGELDWIVMKTLEKDRSRRYESTNEFAKDIQRYLDDEPVEACPPSHVYRFRKFARRNRTLLAASTMVVLALCVGAGLATWQAAVATRERQEADRQREIAQENYRRARDTVDKYLTRVSAEPLLLELGLQPLRKDLLEMALVYYRQFAAEQRDDSNLQKDLADAYVRVGEITSETGQAQESLQAYNTAKEIYSRLASANPGSKDYLKSLAGVHFQIASQQWALDALTEAVESFRRARSVWQAMIEEFGPHNGWRGWMAKSDLLSARILSVNGKDEEARACLLQARALALQILTDSPDNVNTIKLRGEISFDLGQLESALEDFTSVIELTPWRRSLYYNRASVYRAQGKFDLALADCATALDLDPKKDNGYFRASHVHGLRGVIYRDDLRQYEKAVEEFTKVIELERGVPPYYRNRAKAYEMLGDFERAAADRAQADHFSADHAETERRSSGKPDNKRDSPDDDGGPPRM